MILFEYNHSIAVSVEKTVVPSFSIFRTFLQAGFECSSHKRRSGERLDLLRSTKHDCFTKRDYERLRALGVETVRVGARWHLIEQRPREYNFESLAALFDAARETGIELILDLLHFGWPDFVDPFSRSFPNNFGRFVQALTRYVKARGGCCSMFAPINEISFLSWAGGEVAAINPYAVGRGAELKRNLVRAAAVASEILLNELDGVRLISAEPVIHIVGDPAIPGDEREAESYRLSQFEAWDMLKGSSAPELGGRPEYLDIVGVNFYDRNEWVHNSSILQRSDPRYRPLHRILGEVWKRYRRPMFISETGTEGDERAEWFNYICEEIIAAHERQIPVHGVCLYPILNHPGWDDDRHCCNGLFDYADESGNRDTHWPLAHAIINQQHRLQRSYQLTHDPEQHRPALLFPSTMELRVSAASTPHEPLRTCQENIFRRGTGI